MDLLGQLLRDCQPGRAGHLGLVQGFHHFIHLVVFGDRMAAEVDAVVEFHQRDVEMPLFGGFVSLQFGLELFIGFDPFRGVAAGANQRFGIGALAFVAFAQGFENIHGVSSWAAF